MEKLIIDFQSNVREKVSIGLLQFGELRCLPKNEGLWEVMQNLADKYRCIYPTTGDALEKLKPARRLYYSLGMEPTRIRPSSEALFRRVIKNKPLYQINSIVDVCNFCSLYFFLPIGLYDIEKVEGQVGIRVGRVGEEYPGIGKEVVHVGERLVLADDSGPFGNPSADSRRTSISTASSEVLMVIFAPAAYPEVKMKEHLTWAERQMLTFHPTGRLIQKQILD